MSGTATDPRTGPLLDHVTDSDGPAALVSDRGRRRHHNEDAAAIAARPGWVGLVVADGVGGKPEGERASIAAAVCGRDALVGAYEHAMTAEGQLLAAVHGAGSAVAELAHDGASPSTTFVAAVSDGATVHAVSVGDSRAYWIPDGGTAVLLTRDDSFAEELLARGTDPALARNGRHANVITRWLGEGAPALDPAVATVSADTSGWVLLCTDGLWRYLPEEWALTADGQPAEVAERLVAWANERGGADNVTVALARVTGR